MPFNPTDEGFTAIPEDLFDSSLKSIPNVKAKGMENGLLFYIVDGDGRQVFVAAWLQPPDQPGQGYVRLAPWSGNQGV